MPYRPRNSTQGRRELYILRGVPGSGKSSVADALADSEEASSAIFSADAYFTGRDGVYRFDPSRLTEAHAACFAATSRAMQRGIGRIILDNCNIDPEHFIGYEREAARYGYRVVVLVVERRHNGVNAHGVTTEQVQARAARLRNSLQL